MARKTIKIDLFDGKSLQQAIKQIEAYHAKEAARRRWLADYRQWENYRMTLGNKVPKTFNTFLKHKRAGDDKYRDWMTAYKEANNE